MYPIDQECCGARYKGLRLKLVKGHECKTFKKYDFDNDCVIRNRRNSFIDQDGLQVRKKILSSVACIGPKDTFDMMFSSSHKDNSDREFIEDTDFNEGIDTQNIVRNLTVIGRFLGLLQTVTLPRLSLSTASLCFILAIFISPRSCAETIIFPAFRLSFGTLYPAYASYKAVRTKNVKEYVKWMMYWIVYAFFTCTETFTDIFLSWFPFYYEVKVVIVLWLLSPATKGSSTLYRKFVHPMLTRREQEIDEYLNQAKERGYSAVLQLGSKGVNYATNVIMQTAIKGGGNLVQTIRRSYSLSDLSEPDIHRTEDEIDDVVTMRPQQRIMRQRLNTPVGRSASGTRHSTGMYFTEVDVASKGAGDFNYNVRSSDDISSGYSSAEPISGGLSRTSSMTNASKTRMKGKRTEVNAVEYEDNPNTLEFSNCDFYPNVCEKNKIESQFSLQSLDILKKPMFENNLFVVKNKDFDQCADDFFDTKSNASEEIHLDDNNNDENDLVFCGNVNLSEMRTSLKDIENNFRTNIDYCNNQRSYIHKKGKAPQPPSKPPFEEEKTTESISHSTGVECNAKETEI